ncbi:ABC transporter ATP-binding protein [Celerinatantimonas sp. YJH-8]|uniref:ABC transporter ATP-binding protein n=1 Tax=Celerinatantimonas sp. YJH-8 TaxID=3228714 RepID=UPI0038BEF8EA
MSQSLLQVKGVTRIFESAKQAPVQALTPIHLNVEKNDFVTILGPSGCGKSTLLRIVAGLDTPSSGQLYLNQAPITGPSADRGMVFQSYTLFPWLTVAENIRYGLTEKGMNAKQQQEICQYYLNQVGLKDFADHYPRQLSGGMQQRTAIARALANSPKMLLMDEPFGALDNQTRVMMQELLLNIWEKEKTTVMFVTHDIDEAIFMANRVVIFSARPGRIKTELASPFEHPRHYTLKTTPEFMALKSQITEEIRQEMLDAFSA